MTEQKYPGAWGSNDERVLEYWYVQLLLAGFDPVENRPATQWRPEGWREL